MKSYEFSLYLVTDRVIIGSRNLTDVVAQAVQGGVTAVQIREKDSTTREFIQQAQQIKKILSGKEIPLIINDRVDVAQAVQADGVHLGQQDMHVKQARNMLGKNAIIGLSVENMQQLKQAEDLEIDHISISPLFLTATKPELNNAWGLQGLREASARTSHKIIAIGGIHSENVEQVIKAGAHGVAVVSDICGATDPRAAAQKLSDQISTARG